MAKRNYEIKYDVLDGIGLSYVKRPDKRDVKSGDSWTVHITELMLEKHGETIESFWDSCNGDGEVISDAINSGEFEKIKGVVIKPLSPGYCSSAEHNILKDFVACHKMGVFPPPWIMNTLAERFEDYLTDNANGEGCRLGEYFGEGPGQEKMIQFKKDHRQVILKNACMIVEILQDLTGREAQNDSDLRTMTMSRSYEIATAYATDAAKSLDSRHNITIGKTTVRDEYLRLMKDEDYVEKKEHGYLYEEDEIPFYLSLIPQNILHNTARRYQCLKPFVKS